MHWFWTIMGATVHALGGMWRAVTARRFLPAQGLVEYGLVLVLIAIFAVGAIAITGKRISTVYKTIDCGLRDARMGSPDCQ